MHLMCIALLINTEENNMTFIYIIKTIAAKWINTLSNTHMMKDLVAQETQSIRMAKQVITSGSNPCSVEQRCDKL